MKTNNPIIDNMIDTQTQVINNWVNTTKKFQNAMTGGSLATEGQHIYKEWMDKQTHLFGNVQNAMSSASANNGKPEEFFKNWYNQQSEQIKKMTDFNQSLYSSFANFGKAPSEYMSNYNNVNTAWTNIYNTWMATLNSTYDTFSKNIPHGANLDAFKNMYEGNKVYFKLQEFFQPAFNAFKSGQFNAETLKKYSQPETYKAITEQMFHSMVGQASMKEVFDSSIKNIQDFFVNQNNLSKEYAETFQNISKEFPQLVSGDFAKITDMYKNAQNVFGKSFEPIMKLAQPGKEKEAIEANLQLLDKISEYSVKQAQLQYQMYTTTQKAVETSATKAFEKMSPEAIQQQSFTEFYNEWLKTNETLFTELFASEEFSKLKGDILSISLDVKKQFEKQYENVFGSYPVVFKSQVEELYKTIYDLKKQVREMQDQVTANAFGHMHDGEKVSNNSNNSNNNNKPASSNKKK